MKKYLSIITILLMSFCTLSVQAQDETQSEAPTVEEAAPAETVNSDEIEADEGSGEGLMHVLKTRFIEGGPVYMGLVLICLILGLAVCIERILSLSLSDVNISKLLRGIDDSLKNNDVEKAKELCKSTRGPVASVLYQGLDRVHEGVDIVEKSIVSYGSVQMGRMEKGISWISLFIAIAPMLGFLGTVIGMVVAFDTIQQTGEVDPVGMAGGIKIALLTTIFGLLTAVILQIFYSYIISKVDSLVNKMEDASISLIDMIVKYNVK